MTLTASEARQRMIGGWTLLSFTTTLTSPTGVQTTTHNVGTAPLGRLLFTSDGWMSTIGNDPSALIPTSTPWVVASDAEIAAVARYVLAYFGQYRVDVVDGEVRLVINVHVALDPSTVGTKQERRAEFRDVQGRECLVLRPLGDFMAPVRCRGALNCWRGD